MNTHSLPVEPGAQDSLRWYVIRVRSNAERKVAHILRAKEVDVFLPLQKCASRRKGADPIDTPLFPGYLFVRFNRHKSLPVVACPGVVNVLRRGKEPEPVDSSEIFALQELSTKAKSLTPLPMLANGKKVHIVAGPLADMRGVVVRDEGRRRLIVSVSLLQRSVEAEVNREWVDDCLAEEVM
jgi:transcriptional antiterminator NusG